MSNSWLKEWCDSKTELALRLNSGDCGGSYAEAIIILCSVLSGISADIWPGKFQDKKRFVELLIKYAGSSLNCERVSIPLLVGAVRSGGDIKLAKIIKEDLMPLSDSRVITGDDVDKSINELKSDYPTIDIKTLKKNCYAYILYEEIRSGYVHEYRPGERADSFEMSGVSQNSSLTYVTYINRLDKTDRLIYFNVTWLTKLIEEIVGNLLKASSLPVYENYNSWWLES